MSAPILDATLAFIEPVLCLHPSLKRGLQQDNGGHYLTIVDKWRRSAETFDPEASVTQTLHPQLFNFLTNKPGIVDEHHTDELVQLITALPLTKYKSRVG